MPRWLCIERPWEDAELVEWTQENFNKHRLDQDDVSQLEKGVVVWYNEIAYTMEEE